MTLLPPGPAVLRVAVLRANHLGDLVAALPALSALRAAHPDARVTWLGAPLHAELLAGRRDRTPSSGHSARGPRSARPRCAS